MWIILKNHLQICETRRCFFLSCLLEASSILKRNFPIIPYHHIWNIHILIIRQPNFFGGPPKVPNKFPPHWLSIALSWIALSVVKRSTLIALHKEKSPRTMVASHPHLVTRLDDNPWRSNGPANKRDFLNSVKKCEKKIKHLGFHDIIFMSIHQPKSVRAIVGVEYPLTSGSL